MHELLFKRLQMLESDVRQAMAAPTLPIYDINNFPEDAIAGQVAIGSDGGLNWYDGLAWNSYPSSLAIRANTPQDVIEGQLAIGIDCSLCWFVNDGWHTVAGTAATGNVPQDAIEGQIVIGNNTIGWYCDSSWWGLAI